MEPRGDVAAWLASLPIDEPIRVSTGLVRLKAPTATSVLLLLDSVPSSELDLADPTYLAFEYMQWMTAVVLGRFPPAETGRLRALHLGGGGCALPRALAAHYPAAHQLVIELDAKLCELVRAWFRLPPAPFLKLRPQEAGEALRAAKPKSRDVIVRDAFYFGRVPPQLTGPDYQAQCARVLAPGGLYLANCAGTTTLDAAKAEVRAAAAVFPHVAAIGEPAQFKGRRWGNIVIAGSTAELPAGLERDLRKLAAPARAYVDADAIAWAR
jgi:spermidine synthase